MSIYMLYSYLINEIQDGTDLAGQSPFGESARLIAGAIIPSGLIARGKQTVGELKRFLPCQPSADPGGIPGVCHLTDPRKPQKSSSPQIVHRQAILGRHFIVVQL
jgi:hypothetical protein